MKQVATARAQSQIARPLKVLVPLIKEELEAGDEAGIEHYRHAGEMLLEAREQVSRGSWGPWLGKNFELSKSTAFKYMRLASHVAGGGVVHDTIHGTLGIRQSDAARRAGGHTTIHNFTSKVNVT